MKMEREEFDFDEFFEYLQRRRKKTYRQLTPTELKKQIVDGLMKRIECQCRKHRYAVISCFKENKSKHRNFRDQYRMAERIVTLGLSYTPVISFWENIGDRSLFISSITRGMTRKIAQEFVLTHYVLGYGGYWRNFETAGNTAVSEGFGLKILSIDTEFYLYVRIQSRKNVLRSQMANMKEYGKSKYRQENEGAQLRRRLADLQRAEKELMH